jgi:anthranilate 1,2-dioxygenase small subunit
MQTLFARVSAFHARYSHCIDDGQLEEWPGFFVEDCHYRITTADNYRRGLESGLIWANSRAMLIDRVRALRNANIYERQHYRHLLGQCLVGDLVSGEASCETAFLVVRTVREGAADLFASGRYVDQFRVTDEAVQLMRRVVVCDSSHIDTLLALPL